MDMPHYSQPLILGNGGRCLHFWSHRWVSGRSTLSLAGTLDGDLLLSCSGLRKSLQIPLVIEGPTWLASYQPCSTGTAEAAAGTRTPNIVCAGFVCVTAAHSCLLSPPDQLVCCRIRKCLPWIWKLKFWSAKPVLTVQVAALSGQSIVFLCSLLWHHTKCVCCAVFSLQYLPRDSSESDVIKMASFILQLWRMTQQSWRENACVHSISLFWNVGSLFACQVSTFKESQ